MDNTGATPGPPRHTYLLKRDVAGAVVVGVWRHAADRHTDAKEHLAVPNEVVLSGWLGASNEHDITSPRQDTAASPHGV